MRITATVRALCSLHTLPDLLRRGKRHNFIEFTPIEGCEGRTITPRALVPPVAA